MKSLSATLLAAQKKPDRLPYVEAKVYDFEQGIKRLSWTRLYEGSETDNHHGIAFDGQGSMHRIRADAGNKLYRQKITSPDEGSDYSSWTEIATNCAGPCAIAAYGAKVYIFYKTTTNSIRIYSSHDYGDTWERRGSDFLNDGTASADSERPNAGRWVAANAFDNDEATAWMSTNTPFPHWVKYDLGSGVSKTARRLRLKPMFYNGHSYLADFKLQGSNNDSDWTDIISETAADTEDWQEWEFENNTAYRYYRIYATSSYQDLWASIKEIELMELDISYADVLSLAASWKIYTPYNIVVCFALKAQELNAIVLDTSDQTTSQHIKTFSEVGDAHHFSNTYGIGAVYNQGHFCTVFAAKEVVCDGNPYPYTILAIFFI